MERANHKYLTFIFLLAAIAAASSIWNLSVSIRTKELVENQRIERPMPDYASTWESAGIKFTVSSYADRAPEGEDAWEWHRGKLEPALIDFSPDSE